MNIKLRADFSKIILAMLIFFFPMIVFWIGGRPIYVWLELLFVVVCILKYKKYYAIKYIAINLMLLTRFLSAISAQTGNLPAYLHKSAIVQTVYALIAYLAVSYVYHAIEWNTFDTLSTIIKAFKLMVMVELFWIPLQFICYYVFSTDINKLLFVDTFHMVENASFVRSWVWYPSGLSWHSALLAPMFVIGLLIFDNLWVRVFIVADALICGNSTTLIGPTVDEFTAVVAEAIEKQSSGAKIDDETVMIAASVQLNIKIDDASEVLLCGDASPVYLHDLDKYDLIQLPHHGKLESAQKIFDALEDSYIKEFLVSDNTGSGATSGGSDKLIEYMKTEKMNAAYNTKNGVIKLPKETGYDGYGNGSSSERKVKLGGMDCNKWEWYCM